MITLQREDRGGVAALTKTSRRVRCWSLCRERIAAGTLLPQNPASCLLPLAPCRLPLAACRLPRSSSQQRRACKMHYVGCRLSRRDCAMSIQSQGATLAAGFAFTARTEKTPARAAGRLRRRRSKPAGPRARSRACGSDRASTPSDESGSRMESGSLRWRRTGWP